MLFCCLLTFKNMFSKNYFRCAFPFVGPNLDLNCLQSLSDDTTTDNKFCSILVLVSTKQVSHIKNCTSIIFPVPTIKYPIPSFNYKISKSHFQLNKYPIPSFNYTSILFPASTIQVSYSQFQQYKYPIP